MATAMTTRTRTPNPGGLSFYEEKFWADAGFDAGYESGKERARAYVEGVFNAVPEAGGLRDAKTRKAALKAYVAGFANGVKKAARDRKENPARFERCVKEVQAKARKGSNGARGTNAYAVCTAAGTRYLRHNPEDAAATLFETFHGKPAEEIITVREDLHVHEFLTTLAILTGLHVDTESGYEAEIHFPDPETDSHPENYVYLASAEDGRQYYCVGGDQALDLNALHMEGEWERDKMVIGRITAYEFITEKTFDQGEGVQQPYIHKVGEEIVRGKRKITTDVKPVLLYDLPNRLLEIAGGLQFTDEWMKR